MAFECPFSLFHTTKSPENSARHMVLNNTQLLDVFGTRLNKTAHVE